MRLLLLFLLFVQTISSAKIAIFVLEMANSQVIWNQRVAETLLQDGHNVTMIMTKMYAEVDRPKVDIDPRVHQHFLDAEAGGDFKAVQAEMSELIFADVSMLDARFRAVMGRMKQRMSDGCRVIVKNKEFIKWLSEEKFDIAFTHTYDYCPIGMIHIAKIPSWVWLNSGPMMDFVADAVGVPLIPSYVPPLMMESGSKMSFYYRIKSFIGHGLMKALHPVLAHGPQTEIFRELYDPEFPDLIELAKKAPLVMVNSNELYESARPTLHKVVNIGGLGMQFKDAKPLTEEFQAIVDGAEKGVILMSFGSVVKAQLMPQQWKDSLLTAFSRFPDYQFVVRYDERDLDDRLPANVHLHKWLPQNDLLKHEKTIGFISHGGYNSIQETLISGKPIITIALFGDQPKNAVLAAELGFGINIPKGTISANTVERALKTMIEDNRYTSAAKRMSEMIKKKPIKPEELLRKWTAFLAEFKTLDNLVPYGTHLSFIQYHSIDVIAFLSSIVLIVFYVIFFTLRFAVRKAVSFYTGKTKTD